MKCPQLLFVAIMFGSGLASQVCHANDGPYCGLHCLHAALHSLKIESDINQLTVPANLSGKYGSTAEDIIRIAKQKGASAIYRLNLTLADLRSSTTPVILHTSIVTSRTSFHHWILFLGMGGEYARVYAPPRSTYSIPVAELMGFWDRRGIIVSLPELVPARFTCNVELVFAFSLVLATHRILLLFSRIHRSPVAAILIASLVSGIVWHTITDLGFIHHYAGTSIVAGRFVNYDAPILGVDQFHSLLRKRKFTIVDARLPEDYLISHIPGAINLPFTVTHGDLREALLLIPQDLPVVVNCQSNQCTWSDRVAEQLSVRGYQPSVLRDGLAGWTKAGNAEHGLAGEN